jgi:formiminotetrahydrofolate cyclodeaminase
LHLKLIHNSIEEIMVATGKTSPSIGGSTAAALSALIAISVAKMALLISAEKETLPDLEAAATRLDSISMRLQDAAEADAEALQRCLAAAKAGQETTNSRNDATIAPLASAHLVLEALELLERHSPDVSQLVLSDYYSGCVMIDGAFAAILMAVDANLRTDEMLEFRKRSSSDRARLNERRTAARRRINALAAEEGFVL